MNAERLHQPPHSQCSEEHAEEQAELETIPDAEDQDREAEERVVRMQHRVSDIRHPRLDGVIPERETVRRAHRVIEHPVQGLEYISLDPGQLSIRLEIKKTTAKEHDS